MLRRGGGAAFRPEPARHDPGVDRWTHHVDRWGRPYPVAVPYAVATDPVVVYEQAPAEQQQTVVYVTQPQPSPSPAPQASG